MLSINEVLAAAVALVSDRFPGEAVYTNRVPAEGERPGWMVTFGKSTLADTSAGYLEATLQVIVTAFVAVDDYYNSQFEELARRMQSVMELFAVGYLEAGNRALHVEGVEGESGLDFAEVTVTLWYQDSRPATEEEYPLMGSIQAKYCEEA